MLKLILLLDCDECGQARQQAPVYSVFHTWDWYAAVQTLMTELADAAREESWDYQSDRMLCGLCRPDEPDEEN